MGSTGEMGLRDRMGGQEGSKYGDESGGQGGRDKIWIWTGGARRGRIEGLNRNPRRDSSERLNWGPKRVEIGR